jgi:hypothetical protein
MVSDDRLASDDPGGERARRMFLAAVARLDRETVLALGGAVGALVSEGADRTRTTKGFLFAWYDGPSLSNDERFAFGAFFQEVMAALASALTGTDPHALVPPRPQKAGLAESLRDMFLPRRQWNELGDISVRLIENSLAPVDPQPCIVAAWNAGCAVWMRGHIAPETEAVLTAPWRRAVGDLPS